MKRSLCVGVLFMYTLLLHAQELKNFNLYNPQENADSALVKVIGEAKKSGKHVFLQIGGNWCVWCMRFQNFITADASIDSLVKASYVVYHLNYSSENRNKDLLTDLGFPQRFGFPVFCILDANGLRIHTQDSALLEEGEGYDRKKVWAFLANWSPKALEAKQYKTQ